MGGVGCSGDRRRQIPNLLWELLASFVYANLGKMTMQCHAVVFDLDGVLIDSTPCHERHWKMWAANHGLDGRSTFKAGHGIRTIDHIRMVAPHLDAIAEAEQFDRLEIEDTNGIVVFNGAHELLSSLPTSRWAVVTSCNRPLVWARLTATGLPTPPVLVSAEDVTQGKPNPEGYLRAIAALGVRPSDTVVVEDSPVGVAAGKAAGAKVIAVTSTHQAIELAAADLVLHSLSELHVQVRSEGLELLT